MRAPSFPWASWKCTVLLSTAEYSLTGTLTSPKVTVPFHSERAITTAVPGRRHRDNGLRPRSGRSPLPWRDTAGHCGRGGCERGDRGERAPGPPDGRPPARRGHGRRRRAGPAAAGDGAARGRRVRPLPPRAAPAPLGSGAPRGHDPRLVRVRAGAARRLTRRRAAVVAPAGYSPTPSAWIGRARRARRVGRARATSASSAETPRMPASGAAGT